MGEDSRGLDYLEERDEEKDGEVRSDSIIGGYPDASDDFWYSMIDSFRAPAGQTVTAKTAQRLSANYACIVAITESIAMLPAGVMERQDDRTVKSNRDHYLYSLLRDAPNSYMDSFEFFDMLQGHACESGNAFAHIQRKKSGAIIQLTPLDSADVEVKMLPGNRLGYTYHVDGRAVQYDQSEIFHFKPHTRDGITGRTPIKVAADVLGLGLALQTHGSNFFKNGAFLSGLLKVPHTFKDDEARKNFVDSFKKVMGASNAGKMGLLEQGAEYTPFQSKLDEAQYAELMNLSVVDIARLWRMPPMFIQQMDKGMSFASSEQLAIVFVQYTIQPWVTRWERAIKRQLLMASERDSYVKFNVSALLRGDLKSRTEAIVNQIQYGLKTINEGRMLLDENPIEHEVGDEPLMSHNLMPASKVMAENPPIDVQPEPDPTPAPEEKTKGALYKLLRDACEKLVELEIKSVKRTLKKKDALIQAETYYQRHQKLMVEALTPVFEAIKSAVLGAKEVDLEEFASVFVEHRGQELADWASIFGSDVEKLNLCVESWSRSSKVIAFELFERITDVG